MGQFEINAFLSSLAVQAHVSASTQNQALSALLFLYRNVLEMPFPKLENVIRAKRPRRLPTVMTRDEVRRVLGKLSGTHKIISSLLYGSGLRLLECLRRARQRSAVRAEPNHDPGCEGTEGSLRPPPDRSSRVTGLLALPRKAYARDRSRARVRKGLPAGRAGAKIPKRRSGLGMAVGLSVRDPQPRSAFRDMATPSSSRDRSPASCRPGCTRCRDQETRDLSRV